MRLARFTISLAMVWASFRMIADIIGRSVYAVPVLIGHTINALLRLIRELLQIAMAAMIIGTFGAMLFWFWTLAGKPMPF